jgi:hypothetical protein
MDLNKVRAIIFSRIRSRNTFLSLKVGQYAARLPSRQQVAVPQIKALKFELE